MNIYELPPVNDPIPEWLPLLAERVAKKRINESGAVEAVSAGLSQLKASIDASTSSDGYTRWAKWFFKDPLQRDADHSFDLTTQEFTDIKSRGSSLLGQYDAFLLEPNNGLIACRIGYLLAVSPLRAKLEQHAQTQWDESALWYCEQGTELSSESGEAWALKGAVEQVLGKSAEESVARALELEPEAPIALYVNSYELHQQGLAKEAYAAFTRAISLLPENRHQLDWENQAPFLVGTLRQILSPKTFSPFVLAQAGVAKLFQTGDTLQRRKVEADWLTRYACELGPDDARVWRMRAQVLASAEKEEELKLAIAKSIEHDEGGSIDWHQYGRLLNERCNELVSQKRFDEAHQYVMQSGIPSRSIEATPDQIDLSSSYNQALIQTPYRLRTQNNNADRTWNRLPIGLVSIDDVLFDVRGMVRLGGGIFANKEFPAPVPRKVSDIGVNRTAEYVHFLHNVAAETSRRTPRGEVVGYYTLTYEDNEQVRLPIRYGKDVIPWVFNSFVKPTRAAVGFAEGHYQSHKTLCHSIWENPRPEARIRSIDFESTNSHSAPFLIAISLESDTFKSSSGDGPSLSSRAYRRSFLTQGQTEKTKSAVDDLSNRALVLEPEDVELAYQRAEVLFQIGKFDEALEMASSLAEQHPERTAFRILEGRVLFKMGRAEEAASRLQRRSGEQPFEICFTQDESLIWDQFTEDVYAQLGEFEGRNFLFKLNIPNRSEDASSYLVDLSEHYNANLEESFFTPRNYPSYTGAFFNRLQPGIHVLEGTPFDIRCVIQLNDRETIAMNNVYPKGVEGIQVGVEGDQVHFLHATFNNDRPGTPTIGYQIHLSNGDVHQHIVRFGIDINDMARDHDTDSPESAIWRAPNITPFAFESDALLHQSTWNNPTPQHTIAHIDARIGVSRAQPFLAAITVESFERQLNRKPEEILQVAQNALRKIKQAYAVNPVVMKYVREVVQKIEAEGMANAEALQTLARIYYRFEEYGKALKAIDASLSLDTGNRAESLRLKSEVLGAMKEFSSARKIQEAIRQAVLDENIVKRGEGTDSRFVDLSSYYNVTLQEFPYQTEQSTRTLTETFDQITPGVSTFAGIEFDVRGIVALSGTETLLSAGVYDLKQEISGVRVDRKASSIHLLHGAGWGDSEPHGTCIGEVILNYEDGENHTIEICAGMHVRDWFLTQFFDRN
ncbi:MAG: tetratricopeptide repeat protein, partial [Planctomycetota bacterium]|nr:tetratricopeptide repeat protein [Planctomycetota bacterium]